jgi:hypoxanthine-guanine phosphoribosyltransferase
MAAKMDEDFQKILSEDPHAKFLLLGVLNGAYMFTSEISLRLKTPVMI